MTNPTLNSHVQEGESHVFGIYYAFMIARDQYVIYIVWGLQVLDTASSFGRGSHNKSP